MPSNLSMKIMGIDPGYDRLGIAVLERVAGKKDVLIYSNCFQTSSKDQIYGRLRAVGQEMSRLMDEFAPDMLAMESLFIAKNQKTAMRVSEARGIIIYEAARRNVPICEYSPVEIKAAVTGDGTSDKGRIAKMVRLLVDMPEKSTKDDEYDAIAVALAHSACYPQRNGVAK